MERLYGKPIDLAKFKQPVLKDIRGHLNKINEIVDYLKDNEKSVEQINCYICKSKKRSHLVSIHGFEYVICEECGHVYTTKRYEEESIRRFYETNKYWAEITYANKETCHYRRDNIAKPKVEFAERNIKSTSGIWIDVGCGIGDLVDVVRERGWDARGLELSETSVSFAKEVFGVELIRQTLTEYLAAQPEIIGKVSVVSLIGVLEHVVDPIGLLNDAYKALHDEGTAIIQVPNADSLSTMIQTVFPDNVFRHMSPIEHIMVFTESSLFKGFERTGFIPKAIWHHGLDIYELLTNIALMNERTLGSRFFNTIMDTFNELQMVIDQHELSDRILCVAHKNP